MEGYFSRRELLSSSQIKSLIKKGEDKKDEYRNQFVLGDLVDKVLTENGILVDLCIVDRGVELPKPQLKLFVDCVFKLYKYDLDKVEGSSNPDIREDYLTEAYTEVSSKSKTYEQMLEDFNKSPCQTYWSHLIKREKSYGKALILEYEEQQVLKCIKDVRESKFDKYFSINKGVFNQLEIYTKYFKIKLDCLYFDYDKLEIQLIDLKTCATFTENAMYNILAFRYDIQAYFYHFVVKLILSGVEFTSNNEEFNELMKFRKAITLSPTFNFIFVSKIYNSQVLEIKYRIENEKEILGRRVYTTYDVEKAIEIHRFCRDNNVEANLTNYYLLNNSSIEV